MLEFVGVFNTKYTGMGFRDTFDVLTAGAVAPRKKYPDWSFWITSELRIRGALHVDALRGSLGTLLGRHESLRTRIVFVGGEPQQIVDECSEFSLEIVSVTGLSRNEIEENAERDSERFINERVDLAVGPMVRVMLLRILTEEYLLATAIHHIVSDGVSVVVFCRELWTLYSEFVAERTPALWELPTQYSNYASFQREEYCQLRDAYENYWTRKLADSVPLKMPRDTGLDRVRYYTPEPMEIGFDRVESAAL